MRVRLKRKHITKGQCSEPEFCPIALLLKEKTHKPVVVYDAETIQIGEREYRVSNDREASLVDDFISEFDDALTDVERKKFSGFSFTLTPLEA